MLERNFLWHFSYEECDVLRINLDNFEPLNAVKCKSWGSFFNLFFVKYYQNWELQTTKHVRFSRNNGLNFIFIQQNLLYIFHFVQPFEKSQHFSMLQAFRFDLCSITFQVSKENSTNSKITNQHSIIVSGTIRCCLDSSKHININFPSVCWVFFKTCVLSSSSSEKIRNESESQSSSSLSRRGKRPYHSNFQKPFFILIIW